LRPLDFIAAGLLLAPTVGLIINNLIWGRRCD
jgi:hypothetical protein